MARKKPPLTAAVRALRQAGAAFEAREYKYVEHGGTAVAAQAFGVDEHNVIKTLVFKDQDKNPLIVLMHGDKEVSTKKLARELGVKAISPCDPKTANKHTGYNVGGISPFGTRKRLPVYVEASIFDLEFILINGGKRGLLVEMKPADLEKVLEKVEKVRVGI